MVNKAAGGVTTQANDYAKYAPHWRKIDDLCFRNNLDQFLLTLNESDKSQENATRNRQYKDRAIYYNVVGQTYRGLLGAAFNKHPEIALPASLQYLMDNADGKGISLYQQSQSLTGDVIRKGRAGMFVSFPRLEDGKQASRAQMQSGEMAARIEHIDAKDVINWRTRRIGNREVLTLVVFQQYEDTHDLGSFDTDFDLFYRVLSIDETGRYLDQKYHYTKDDEFDLVSESYPTMSDGQPWREIPFMFVGSENNDHTVDFPPLLDLAEVNIGHFRNSADYEDSVFYAGQPQPWMSGIDDAYLSLYKQEGLYIGAKRLMPVPSGETFGFAAAPPNPLVREAMSDKIQLMLNLGARLLQPGAGNKTATQIESENAASESVLSLIVSNVEEAYQTALAWCDGYMGGAGDIVFQMSRDFGTDVADPAELAQLVAAWNQGVLPTTDLWAWMRSRGVIREDRTDGDLDQDLGQVAPLRGDSVA